MTPDEAIGVPMSPWWYRLVRDKFPATLPEGSYVARVANDAEYITGLMDNLIKAGYQLKRGFAEGDEDVIYRNAAEIVECLSFALVVNGKNLRDLDDELDAIEEEEGSYGDRLILTPSESALAERLGKIR